MKKEVAFFKDKRGKVTAMNLIKFYRSLGYTDKQILEEMKRIKLSRETQNLAKETCMNDVQLGLSEKAE